MSRGWLFKSGEYNFTCDSCGQKLKSSKGKKRWDGFMVCQACWEPRHPQDFLRARKDNIAIPWARSKQDPVFSDSIGWQDLVTLSESGAIIIIQNYEEYFDNIPVSELVTILRAVALNETIPVSEQFSTTNNISVTENDFIYAGESGEICILDYVDSTYFSEIYIGTCSFFPTVVHVELVTPTETGSLTNPYVEITYFLEDYVGDIVVFNP